MTTGEPTTGAGTTEPATTEATRARAAAAGAPAGWYDDPQDPTRLRRWDGRGWTDSWMPRAASAPAGGGALPHRALPGWHPDPADPGRVRYWDGSVWTARVRSGPVHPRRGELGPGFGRLARWVQGLLVVSGVLAGLTGLADVWSYTVLDGWLDGAGTTAEAGARLDTVAFAGSVVAVGTLLATGVPFLVWLYRAYGSDAVDPVYLHHARGWTIGGWFVPGLNLWWPLRIMRDLWTGARAGTPEAARDPLRWQLPVWWAAFLATTVLDNVSSRIYAGADLALDPESAVESLRLSAAMDVGVALLDVVAAGLAVVLVREITAALRRPERLEPLPNPPAEG